MSAPGSPAAAPDPRAVAAGSPAAAPDPRSAAAGSHAVAPDPRAAGRRGPAFGLRWSTPPEWVARVEREPLALLSDHAHCEMKAAASAQGLIAKNCGRDGLVARLGALAVEEMEHFGRVVVLLHARGGRLGPVERNPYTEALLAAARATSADTLLDRLCVSALIEARSLERFRLLARHLADRELAALYRGLVRSEAGHRALFVELARELFGRARADARLAELALAEGRIAAELPFAPRMHAGLAEPAP